MDSSPTGTGAWLPPMKQGAVMKRALAAAVPITQFPTMIPDESRSPFAGCSSAGLLTIGSLGTRRFGLSLQPTSGKGFIELREALCYKEPAA